MRNYLAPLIAIGSMFAIVACSNGGGGSSAPTPVCPATHTYDATNNTCVPVKPSPTPTPTVGSSYSVHKFWDYDRFFVQNYNGMPTVYNGNLQITHPEGYKAFLREALAVCDRNIMGWNWGLHDCNAWIGGSFQIAWNMDSSMVPVVQFKAYPPANLFNYALSIGVDSGAAALNPLTLPMQSHQQTTFSLINNSTGYEIRANGSAWNGGGLRLIQIQVHKGTLADDEVAYELHYPYNNQPTKIATGRFKRY